MRTALEKYAPTGTTSTSGSGERDEGIERRRKKNLEKARVMEMANGAIEELVKMADSGEPLWVRSVETGRELLNYDVYMKEFAAGKERPKRSEVEASRESGVVLVDLHRLVQSFMDVVRIGSPNLSDNVED